MERICNSRLGNVNWQYFVLIRVEFRETALPFRFGLPMCIKSRDECSCDFLWRLAAVSKNVFGFSGKKKQIFFSQNFDDDAAVLTQKIVKIFLD